MNFDVPSSQPGQKQELLASMGMHLPIIVDIAGDAIIATNRDQKIVLFNRAAEAIFGYQENEVIGQPLDILLPKRFAERHSHHVDSFIGAPETARYMHARSDISALRKDGTEFLAEASISKLERGDQTFLMVILRDVTDRRKAEDELRKALDKQKEISDLKSRLISIISHELRTPLAIIQSSTELLERYEDRMTLERKQECYQHITEQVMQLSDLVEDTLTVTRADVVGLRFTPQPDNLERFCYGIVSNFELADNGAHRFVYTVDCPSTVVLFDKKLLWQSLNNLLSNAIKYSPNGGSIYIHLMCDSKRIQIQVRDEGMGIPEADQKELFANFHRGSNVAHIHGTGLGLVIARQAAVAHGGDLSFESQEGVGTTFTITIPLSQSS